jgi:hypothetical protein
LFFKKLNIEMQQQRGVLMMEKMLADGHHQHPHPHCQKHRTQNTEQNETKNNRTNQRSKIEEVSREVPGGGTVGHTFGAVRVLFSSCAQTRRASSHSKNLICKATQEKRRNSTKSTTKRDTQRLTFHYLFAVTMTPFSKSFLSTTSFRHGLSQKFHKRDLSARSKLNKKRDNRNYEASSKSKQTNSQVAFFSNNSKNKNNNNDSSNSKISSSSAYRHTNYRYSEKRSSAASILMDQWETSVSQNSNHTTNLLVQRQRFDERQQAFCQTIVEYRNLWYSSFEEKEDNKATYWKEAMQFQHPTSLEKQQGASILVNSEPLFQKICWLCHDLFVSAALLAESETNPEKTQESNELLTSIITFWEIMRKDRAALVQTYYIPPQKPPQSTYTNLVNSRKEEEKKESGNWVTWIKYMVGGSSSSASSQSTDGIVMQQPPLASGKTQNNSIIPTAHQDTQYAPNHYHYNKLVGRLYFSFSPLLQLGGTTSPSSSPERNQLLQERATHIQRILDQVPSSSSSNQLRSQVLTDKTIRLLIRSYQDIGTLDAAYQTEQIYHKYPNHRKGLLWYVLMSYLKITDHSPGKKYSPKSAALATKRVCELLSKQVSSNTMNPNEFHSCATIGFQCLANIAVDSLEDYYERVNALAALKFGAGTWGKLQKSSSLSKQALRELPLRSKDSTSLQLLVQIYAKQDDPESNMYLQKAQSLLNIVFVLFPTHELKESLDRSTFHSLFQALDKKRKRQLSSKLETDDFDYALGLLDRMISHEVWYPNDITFNHLFRLVQTGPQADQVLTYLELLKGITQEYALSPLQAAKHSLRVWLEIAKEQAASSSSSSAEASLVLERAWDTFQKVSVLSKPLLSPLRGEVSSHIYYQSEAPSSILYSLVWEICHFSDTNNQQRALEIALQVYQIAKDNNDLGNLTSPKSWKHFLKCLAWSGDSKQRLEIVHEIIALQTKQAANANTTNKDGKQKTIHLMVVEALLDSLLTPLLTPSSSTDNESSVNKSELELIQDIYSLAIQENQMPILTDRFLTHLGKVHPQLYERHIAKHPENGSTDK